MVFARLESPRPLTLQRRVSMTIYSSTKAVPYVYVCTHKETNQFYIGYRERNVKLNIPSHLDLPEYKTSSNKVRPDWENYTWTILAEFFDPSDAYTFEQQLICDNWKNLLLLNEHYRLGEHKQFRCSGHSDKSKKKMSISRTGKSGRPHTDETKKKMHDAKIGILLSDKHKQNMSISRTGKLRPGYHPQRKIECPHCNLVGGVGNMTRYHFDHCKSKPD